MNAVEWVVWTSLFLVVYSYGIFPVLLVMYSATVQARRDLSFVIGGNFRRQRDGKYEPSVSVIISAYNEERCIAERIQNLLDLDYPVDRIRFYIGSDGSQDRTAEISRQFDDKRLVFIDFSVNRGKSSVLNDLVGRTQDEVLVFSDANTFYQKDAVRKLVRHFEDAEVGAVCGELKLVASATGENQDGVYWKYERVLKFNESRVGALLGANGAIYAVRRCVYRELPTDTVVDDFTIAMNVAIDGYQVKYDPEAIAIEEVAPSQGDEFNRRVRIGAGNYQALFRLKVLLNPRFGVLWWAYVSHKVLRWIAPILLTLALAGSIALSITSIGYVVFSVLQLLAYWYSYTARNRAFSNKLIHFVVFWINMNIALGMGAIRYFKGAASGTWSSTKR